MSDTGALWASAFDNKETAKRIYGEKAVGKAGRTVAAAVSFLAVGYAAGLVVHLVWFNDKQPFRVAGNISTFAMLFVLALAIERIIQPLSPGLGLDSTELKEDLRKLQAGEPPGADKPTTVQQAQAAVDDARSKTALVTWGLASGLGFLLTAALNVTLLTSILEAGSNRPWYFLDLLVTGFVIGAGTKPLNDLVTRLEKKPAA